MGLTFVNRIGVVWKCFFYDGGFMHREMLFLSWKTLLMIQNIEMCFQFYA